MSNIATNYIINHVKNTTNQNKQNNIRNTIHSNRVLVYSSEEKETQLDKDLKNESRK